MLVVSNTSPVLNLAIIGQLDLLPGQFGQVLIPQSSPICRPTPASALLPTWSRGCLPR